MTRVIVTFRVLGLHAWPDAPQAVSYLALPHRHEFCCRVEAEAQHDDRQVEFHMWKTALLSALDTSWGGTQPYQFGARSCEMLAREIAKVSESVGVVCSAVEVWEDGENGARVDW